MRRISTRKASRVKAAQSQSVLDWEAVVSREYKELRALLSNTPSAGELRAAGQIAGETDPEDHAAEDRSAEAAANRSIRLGVAFHEAMERVDFLSANGISDLAQSIAIRHRLDPASIRMLESMMRASLNSDLLQQGP